MSDPATMPPEVKRVIERFPTQADLILRLAAQSESFRAICEDYALAVESLQRFEALARAQVENKAQVERKIADYRGIVLDLAQEIERSLAMGSERSQ